MKLRLLDENEIDNLKFVTSKLISKKKFDPNGLFSEQIFGPIKTNRCQCKITTAPENSICPECGVEITSNNKRRTTFAKIKVNRTIHPVALEILLSFNSIKKYIDKLLSAKYALEITTENNIKNIRLIKYSLEDYELLNKDNVNNIKLGLDGIYELAVFLIENNKFNESKLLNLLNDIMTKDLFFVNYVIVIPPSYRPISISNDGKDIILDEINKLYLSILELEVPKLNNYRFKSLYDIQVLKINIELHQYIFDLIGKKEGILRSNMASKRVDFSGRAVIVPDSTINIDEAKIPKLILSQLWELEIISELLKQKKYVTFKYAYNYLQKCYEQQIIEPEVEKIIDEITLNKIVILNRQPTLHRGSMIAFKVIPSSEFTIGINPLVCDPFNADFDGDQMAIYRPLSEKSNIEAETKMLSSNNLFSSADGSLQYTPAQDIVYGLYKISNNDKTRSLIEEILGHKVSSTLTKKKLISLLSEDVKKDYTILDKLKDLGFSYVLEYPNTLSLKDFKEVEVENITNNPKLDMQILNEHNDVIRSKFPKHEIIDSGARASWDQVRQMISCRGYVSDFYGNIVPYFIKNSYSKGLNQKDFFYSCYGTRKALLDTAVNVSDSGYLTRRLIYTGVNSILDIHNEDCGTSGTIPITLNSKLIKSIMYRNYYLEDPNVNLNAELYKIDENTNVEDLIGKKIYLRSPITCASPNICKTCYGDLYKLHKSKYIGFIAAQTLGERSTQLVLRTFHTGGVAQMDSKGEHDDIVKAISYVEQITDKSCIIKSMDDIVKNLIDLYNVYLEYGNLNLVHFETILSQTLFNKYDNKYIRWRFDIDQQTGNYIFDNTHKLSIKSIPSIENWFLGMIFQNPKKNYIAGILSDSNKKPNILEKVVIGKINLEDTEDEFIQI